MNCESLKFAKKLLLFCKKNRDGNAATENICCTIFQILRLGWVKTELGLEKFKKKKTKKKNFDPGVRSIGEKLKM